MFLPLSYITDPLVTQADLELTVATFCLKLPTLGLAQVFKVLNKPNNKYFGGFVVVVSSSKMTGAMVCVFTLICKLGSEIG